eukprot:7655646-Alexandrium_andersonii.AAC.1
MWPAAPGPPEISLTQPFSPERGLLTPGRSHAAGSGDGRAASPPTCGHPLWRCQWRDAPWRAAPSWGH